MKTKDVVGDRDSHETGQAEGYFHQLVGGTMSELVAVIESKDGYINQVPYTEVQFVIQ